MIKKPKKFIQDVLFLILCPLPLWTGIILSLYYEKTHNIMLGLLGMIITLFFFLDSLLLGGWWISKFVDFSEDITDFIFERISTLKVTNQK